MVLVDAARGLAVVAMAIYHFSWDLRYFGYITVDVTQEIGWKIFARSIAGSFLLLVGVSLVLASRNGINVRRFLRRLGMIAAGAAAITLVTYLVMPDEFIFFGILHNIVVTSALGLIFVEAPIALVLVAAIISFVLPHLVSGWVFDSPALIWLGLGSVLPRTNDFVPVFPWLGVVLAGIALARLAPLAKAQRLPLTALSERAPWPVLWIGRHSLLVYLLHQPVLFSLVYVTAQIVPPSLLGFEQPFVESCTVQCMDTEEEESVCRRTCACIATRSQDAGLWRDLMRQSLSDEQTESYFGIADQCRNESGPPQE